MRCLKILIVKIIRSVVATVIKRVLNLCRVLCTFASLSFPPFLTFFLFIFFQVTPSTSCTLYIPRNSTKLTNILFCICYTTFIIFIDNVCHFSSAYNLCLTCISGEPTSHEETILSWLGHITKLECDTATKSLTEINWLKNGRSFNKGKIDYAEGVSTLVLVPKNVTDFGNYTCQTAGIRSYHFIVKEICELIITHYPYVSDKGNTKDFKVNNNITRS